MRLQAVGPTNSSPAGTLMINALTGSMMCCLCSAFSGRRCAASHGSGFTSSARTALPPSDMRIVRVSYELASVLAKLAGDGPSGLSLPVAVAAPLVLLTRLARPVVFMAMSRR